jgi:hypothetical protein
MVRLAVQFGALFILATAFATLAVDASRSLAAGSLIVTHIGQTAATLAPAKLAFVQDAVDHQAYPILGQMLAMVLRLPTFLVVGAVGAVALRLTRKAPPKIGYSSR